MLSSPVSRRSFTRGDTTQVRGRLTLGSSTVDQMKSLLRMDEELQILFQRINKKSAKARQTRLKSLRKLAEILKTKEAYFLDGFVKIYAIVFEKLILSENDAEILILNQRCLQTILETSPKSVMKSYDMFLPQMMLSCEETHEEAARLARQNLSILVKDKSKLGKAVLLFCDKFIILLGPLLNNSLSYLIELGCDKDPKVLHVISEKLCQMSLWTLSRALEYVSCLGEEKIDEGFESFRMMLFEESVQIEEEKKEEDKPEGEGENDENEPKKKKKKKKKKKNKSQKKKQIKCFEVLQKYPQSKPIRGALVRILEELFLTKLDEKLSDEVRSILIKKLFSSFLPEENVLIQRNFYTRDLLHRIIQVSQTLKLKLDSGRILNSVVKAIHSFSYIIGKAFYGNLLNVVKSLECTQTLNEEFLDSIGKLLKAFETGFLENRLGHEVDRHFQCVFEVAEWALFEKLNLENEGELIFCDRIVRVFGERWLKFYLQRNNPNQKSFLVRGINEIKYFPAKLVDFLQRMKFRYSGGRVNRFRIIEKMFLSRVYNIVKESIQPTLESIHRTRNLQSFVYQFTQNILLNKDVLLDEIIPFKPRRLIKAQTQAIGDTQKGDLSFLSKVSRGNFSKKGDGLYSQDNLGENENDQGNAGIEEINPNNDFEMSNWSKTGSDVISLGRSVSTVMRRMSDFSNHLLLTGPVDSNGKVYKNPNINLLEISFDVVSLVVHCLIVPLDQALDDAKQGLDFEEACEVIQNVSRICLKTLNPLGLIYYRSSAIRGKMDTVVDHFVTSIERVFNLQILKHRAEKTLMNRSHLRNYYICICELFKSLSSFVSLDSFSSTLRKMFGYFNDQHPRTLIESQLSSSKAETIKEEKTPTVNSFQQLSSFSGLGSTKAKTTNLDELGSKRQSYYALKVEHGRISSITKLHSATNLTNPPLLKGESVAQNIILEEADEGFSGKKSEKKQETEAKRDDIIISQFGQGSLEIVSQTDLDEEKRDDVGELDQNKQKYSNAFRLFHARMFNSMLKEDEEELEDEEPSCTAAFRRRREQEVGREDQPKRANSLVRDQWKPAVLRIEEFFNMLTQIFFGLGNFYKNKDLLSGLDAFDKQSFAERTEILMSLLDKQDQEFKKRDFRRNKDQVVSFIQSMKDFVNHEDSWNELEEETLQTPTKQYKTSKTFKRKMSKFSQKPFIKNQKETLEFNEELFGTVLLMRRFQRIKNLELVGNVMNLGITFGIPGAFLLTRYFLQFDESDLFLTRVFMDSIQSHLQLVAERLTSPKESSILFSLVESVEDSNNKEIEEGAIQLYSGENTVYNKDNKMNSTQNLIKKSRYLRKIKEEKGLLFPLKYQVYRRTGSIKKEEHFFGSLTMEKALLLAASLESFEKKFILKNNNLFLSPEIKRINKINMWYQFWVDFTRYVYSFGVSSLHLRSMQNQNGLRDFRKSSKAGDQLSFDLDQLLNQLLLSGHLSIETLEGILRIVIDTLLTHDLISRETLVFISHLCAAINRKNSPNVGHFIMKELETLLEGSRLFKLANPAHLELFNALLTGFPRADLGLLFFSLLSKVPKDDLSQEKPGTINVLIQIINTCGNLFQFVTGHLSQTRFWAEMIRGHLKEAFLNLLSTNPDDFVISFNQLLWFGRKSFTVTQLLLDVIFKLQRETSVSMENLKEVLCRVYKFIFIQLNSNPEKRKLSLFDFYLRLSQSLPLSLIQFDLYAFVDQLTGEASVNNFSSKLNNLEKSLGYLSTFEIGGILLKDHLFRLINSAQMHLTKQQVNKNYEKELIEKKPKNDEEDTEIKAEDIFTHVNSQINNLAKINEITFKEIDDNKLLSNVKTIFDFDESLEQLETFETKEEEEKSLLNGILLRIYSWLLRQNKVESFSLRIESVEARVKESLLISNKRANSFWRYSCISLLRFIRRVILYIEMFSEEVQKTLLSDVMKLALDFTKQFSSKNLEKLLKKRFNEKRAESTSKCNISLKMIREENLCESFEDFQIEVAETISRFSMRHNLNIPSSEIISLLGSNIPQFRKSAFFLLSRSENTILASKFNLDDKGDEEMEEISDDPEALEKMRQKEDELFKHINTAFHTFFKPKKSSGMIAENENALFSVPNPTMDLLFVSDDVNSLDISSSSNKVLEASVVKFEKKMLPQLLFWSVLLRLASNEWETVIGDHISHFLTRLFEINPAQSSFILERVFLYSRFRQSQVLDILRGSGFSSRKESNISASSEPDAAFLSPDSLLEASEDHKNSELCTTFALNIIFKFATSFPKTLRKFVSLPQHKKIAKFAEHLVSQGISQAVFHQEVRRITQKKAIWETEEFLVSYYTRSQEIMACLVRDETAIQVNIQVPSNYPLKQASVSLAKGLKLPEKKSLKWLLMMKKLLINHNVSLAEALGIWKQNLERQFEGIEPCPICYYVVHFNTKNLPKATCRTCKSKFHNSCISKWFQTSSKAECPMCKSQFV